MDRPLELPAQTDCYGQSYAPRPACGVLLNPPDRYVVGECLINEDGGETFKCGYGQFIRDWVKMPDGSEQYRIVQCLPPHCEHKDRDAYGNLITEDDGTRIDDPSFDDCEIYAVKNQYSDPE